MKTAVKNALSVFLLALMSATVTAQTVKNGEISGIIVSRHATPPASSSSVLYTTPSTGFFILTQICKYGADLNVSGNTIGIIPSGSGDCRTFSPGIAIPPGETLSCTNPYGSAGFTCSITGVLSKK